MIYPDNTVIVAVTLVILALLIKQWRKRPNNFPPGPIGLPIIGVAHKMTSRPEKVFMELSQEYGPIMSLKLMGKFTIVLSSYEAIQEAFAKQQHVFSSRPSNIMFDIFGGSTGIVTTNDRKWRESRKFAVTALSKLGLREKTLERYVAEEALELCHAMKADKRNAFDITKLIVHSTANTICLFSFGKRYDYDDDDFISTAQILNDWFGKNSFQFLMMTLAPYLRHIPPFRESVSSFRKARAKLCSMLRIIVEKHKKEYDGYEIRNFIDAYIDQTSKNGSDPSIFNDEELLGCIRDMFVAGTDTTSSTLKWTILFLINRQQVQRKIQKEIDLVIGADAQPKMSHLKDMHYTQAVMHEMMRLRPGGPLGLPHITTENTRLLGYFIPKDTQITANIWAVHHDPAIWPEPELFKPERFLDEEGKFREPTNFLVFAVGARNCMGKILAKMEYFIFLVALLQHFHLHPASKSSISEECTSSGIFLPPPIFQMRIKERFTRVQSIKENWESLWKEKN